MRTLPLGREWLVDARGCRPDLLRSTDALRALFELLVKDLDLRPLGPPAFHEFPPPGGVTGFLLLAESHLAVHTFPERGFAAVNLYCCRPRPGWDWSAGLRAALGASSVDVRVIERGGR